MNKGYLLGIGIFFSIIIAGVFLTRNPIKNSPLPKPRESMSSEVSGITPAKEFTITESEYAFDPSSIEVKKGDRVRITFVNSGSFEHDFVIDELRLKTPKTKPGATSILEFVAEQTGVYSYYCAIGGHREQGMEGTLTITQ